MQQRLNPINRMISPATLLFLAGALWVTTGAYAQRESAIQTGFKDFPQKKLEFPNGNSRCGYYDAMNKKLYNCKGKEIVLDQDPVKITDQDYCCALEQLNELAEKLQFEKGTGTIKRRSLEELDQVALLLKVDAGAALDIIVSAGENATLTERSLAEIRANSIKDYLISKGVNEGRITTKGSLETDPDRPGRKEKVTFEIMDKRDRY